jgi:multidrug resistance efflux pump
MPRKQIFPAHRQVFPQVDAQIEAAKVNVWRTSQDYDRYANLIKDHSVTQQQYEQALAAKQAAERQAGHTGAAKEPGRPANQCG